MYLEEAEVNSMDLTEAMVPRSAEPSTIHNFVYLFLPGLSVWPAYTPILVDVAWNAASKTFKHTIHTLDLHIWSIHYYTELPNMCNIWAKKKN